MVIKKLTEFKINSLKKQYKIIEESAVSLFASENMNNIKTAIVEDEYQIYFYAFAEKYFFDIELTIQSHKKLYCKSTCFINTYIISKENSFSRIKYKEIKTNLTKVIDEMKRALREMTIELYECISYDKRVIHCEFEHSPSWEAKFAKLKKHR